MIPYGPWRPDVGGPDSGMAATAEGVIAQTTAQGFGYGPYPSLDVASGATALSDDPRGGVALQTYGSVWQQYFATETTLEALQTDYSWSSIDTGRTVPTGDDVAFAHFGSYLLNSDKVDGFHAYNVETSGANAAVPGAPAARFIFSCNNVVIALDCNGNNRRMQSSDIGSFAVWSGGAADGKTFEDGGALIAGTDLKNGAAMLLQESCLRLLQFGQGAAQYGIAKIADGRGCVAARTLVGFDGTAFWWDTDGPWSYSIGGGVQPIGAEKIARWAKSAIGPENYKLMQGAIDPARSLVLWRIDASRLLAYNWLLKEWSLLPAQTAAISRLATAAISIDSVDTPINDVRDAIDSPIWAGSAPQLGALDANRRFATFTGSFMAAELETSRVHSPATGLIGWATPIDDADAGTLRLGVSDRLDADLTWKPGKEKVTSGRVPLRGRGKQIAFRREIAAGADWTYASGIDDVAASKGGAK